jgi:hypothetical protein
MTTGTCIENLVSLNLYRTAVDQTTIIAILCDNRERGTILIRIFLYFIFFTKMSFVQDSAQPEF